MLAKPWAAFCISTFKRPVFLRNQVELLLKQTFRDFEIVISDNDPEASGQQVVAAFNDSRVRYFHNGDNLGMMRSFNKSIERSSADYIVMVTDDDPVQEDLLADMHALHRQYPGYAIYGGFVRNTTGNGPQIIKAEDFVAEILDPDKTPWLLWSSCVIKKEVVLLHNGIPDYGSPHLADHALLAMVGSEGGGVLVNKKYSSLSSHDSNFSKFNFDYYINGCEGFYESMEQFCKNRPNYNKSHNIVLKHIGKWFIVNAFSLRKYYTIQKHDPVMLDRINKFARTIMAFPFMKQFKMRYYSKAFIFKVKRSIGMLKSVLS